MQYLSKLFIVFTLFALVSCDADTSQVEVNYTKAVAIYGDLDEIRATPLIGEVQEIVDPGKIYVGEDYLLIGEEKKGVHILDNTDRSNPTAVGFINIPGNREFYVEDGFLYGESYYDMLKVDISTPTQPKLVNRVENIFEARFLNDASNALIGFDFEKVTEEIDPNSDLFFELQSNYNEVYIDYVESIIPASAVPASFAGSGQTSGTVNRITRQNDHLYAITNSKLAVFKDNEELEFLQTTHAGWGMETIYPHEDFLFVGTRGSMEIYSTDSPENPQVVSSFWHATSCDPVYPIDDTAYLTLRAGDDCPGDRNNLVILNIENIYNPQEVSTIEMESPHGMSLINDVLYVGEGTFGLKLFDASDRQNPTLIKNEQAIEAYDIIPHPTSKDIILVAGPKGFGQYEVDENYNMSLISWIDIQI